MGRLLLLLTPVLWGQIPLSPAQRFFPYSTFRLRAAPIDPKVKDRMGSFMFSPRYRKALSLIPLRVDTLAPDSIRFCGYWQGPTEKIPWQLLLSFHPNLLAWEIEVKTPSPLAIYLEWPKLPKEKAYGLGMQFVPGALDGKRYILWTEEQGTGRGKQPLSFAINLAVPGAAGTPTTTYAPMSTFITTQKRGAILFYEGWAAFHARKDAYLWEIWVLDTVHKIRGAFWADTSWGGLLHTQALLVGPMPLLPDWCRGAWVGLQGGWAVVLPRLHTLSEAGTPIAALWIQDWCGRRETRFGSQLWWRWIPDTAAYPAFSQVVESLRTTHGIYTLGYVNSFLATEGPLYEEALAKGYLVRESTGERPYSIKTPGFPAVLVDLTHPEAYAWLQTLLQQNLLRQGLSGWMTDYGEWLPWDAKLHGGSGASLHNTYARLWAQLNREVTEGSSAVFFTRSGHTLTPRYTRLQWLGDQLVTWDRHDGLRSIFHAVLHSGLSGLPLVHADIGGYTTIKAGPLQVRRSRELFLRWAESCSVQPVFRTHEGLRPGDNHQAYTDTFTLNRFARLARLHHTLWPYLQACSQGYGLTDTLKPYAWAPIWRPLWMHCPICPPPRDEADLIWIGPDLLYAPISRKGQRKKPVRLPPGQWYYLPEQRSYSGAQSYKVSTPLGLPPLFIREGTPLLGEVQAILQYNPESPPSGIALPQSSHR